MRRFIQDQRPGELERLERLAPCAGSSGKKSGEEEPLGGETGGAERRHRGARSGDRAHANRRAMRGFDEKRPRV